MLGRFASVCLALLCLVPSARADVVPQAALKLPLATRVVFLGLANAGERLIAVGERGVVIRSDDGGASWVQSEVPVRATLTAVTFVDAQTGFAVGHDAVVLKTTDGGVNWSLLNFEPDSQVALLNARFRDASRGYVVGSNGQVWSTQDAGASWQRTTLAVEDWYQNHIFDIAWTADGSTLAVAEKGVIYRAADAAGPFQPIESPYDGSFFGAQPLPDGRLLVYGMNGHAFVSADSGSSWQRIDTGTQQFLLTGAALKDGALVLAGGGGTLLRLAPGTLQVSAHQLQERAGITAVLPVGDSVYLATEAGGVQRKPLTELFN
ncbi:MAG: YCF48-related protein [Pseudomonadota bacterium]